MSIFKPRRDWRSDPDEAKVALLAVREDALSLFSVLETEAVLEVIVEGLPINLANFFGLCVFDKQALNRATFFGVLVALRDLIGIAKYFFDANGKTLPNSS